MKNQLDKTIERNYLKRYVHLVEEYELIKAHKHTRFKFVQTFYDYHKIKRQNFIKFYNRYKETKDLFSLLPQKRGPKWKTRRPIKFIENKVVDLRKRGNNKFEIHSILKKTLKQFTPSPSGIYNICKRHNLNRLKPKMKTEKL